MALKAVAAPLGSPVGGSGTTNTIPRWTGASTLGDSIITQTGSTRITVGSGAYAGASLEGVRLTNGVNSYFTASDGTRTVFMGADGNAVVGTLTAHDLKIRAGNADAITVQQGTLNVGIGTASPGFKLVVADTVAGVVTSEIRNDSTNSAATARLRFTTQGGESWIEAFRNAGGALTFATLSTERARIDSAGNLILNTATTGATIQAAGSQQGLKLPATPGNGNANTLDSYQEGTRVLSAGDLSGWTYVTATQYWTLVGRTVTLHTVFTGGTSSATGGATIATPPLLTPLRIAAGAATNSSGTALGNGVCVVASTSSTTGTVITSNAISSSAVDKVLTVTYETAGL